MPPPQEHITMSIQIPNHVKDAQLGTADIANASTKLAKSLVPSRSYNTSPKAKLTARTPISSTALNARDLKFNM